MSKCYYCQDKAYHQLKNGRWCCCKSSNSCPAQKAKNSRSNKGQIRAHHNSERMSEISKGKDKWNSGKTYEEVLGKRKSNSYKKKISKGLEGKCTGYASTPEKEKAKRQKISKAIKKRYAEGWMPKAGRCKKIRYISPIAGKVLLDGSWELAVAEFLDILQIDWRRNKNRFAYFFDKKDRFYTPDFYLVKTQTYIEVKGYETDKDRAKWKQFPHEIKILKKAEVKLIKRGIFTKKDLDRLDSHWCGTPDC